MSRQLIALPRPAPRTPRSCLSFTASGLRPALAAGTSEERSALVWFAALKRIPIAADMTHQTSFPWPGSASSSTLMTG